MLAANPDMGDGFESGVGDVEMAHVSGAETSNERTVSAKPGKSVEHPNYKEKLQPGNGPPVDRLISLLNRTNYKVEVTPHMRKYGGPPPDGTPRPFGTELFVGKLARNCFEDELVPLFETYGTLWEIRILTDPDNQNGRGFAFITYVQTDACPKAVAALNEKTVQTTTGRKLTLTVTHNQHRIFVGSIPKERTRQELLDAFKPELEGLFEVIVHSVGDESGEKFRNRGFCFLEFDTHDHAGSALQRIQVGKTNPFKNRIYGDWAQAQAEPDEDTMKSVKVLFLNNLTNEQTEEALTEALKPYAGFMQVKKSHAYAFAHFDTRESAEKAFADFRGKIVAGNAVNYAWARPTERKNKPRTDGGGSGNRNEDRGGGQPMRGGRGGFRGGFGERGGRGGGGYGNGSRRGGRNAGGDNEEYDDRRSSGGYGAYIPPPPMNAYAGYPYAAPPAGYGPPPPQYHMPPPPGWPAYPPVAAHHPYAAPPPASVPPPVRQASSVPRDDAESNGSSANGNGVGKPMKSVGERGGRGGSSAYKRGGVGVRGGGAGYANGRGGASAPPPPHAVPPYGAMPMYGYPMPPSYADYAAYAAHSYAMAYPPPQHHQPPPGSAAGGGLKRPHGDGQQSYQQAKKKPYPSAQGYAAYPGYAVDDGGFQHF